MAEYARVASFEGNDDDIRSLVDGINQSDGPPEGIPATRITVLADRAAGTIIVATRFASEEDLRVGSATLEAMSPADTGSSMRRTGVETYEVVLEMQA
ncbi:MAG TPA: hypothetical protein VEH79_02320 [Gaiellaceae bacterium]|nr:hypothetical protein [Gaiellaceae bacterium]